MKDPAVDSSKIYKIKYSINLLPQIGAHILTEQVSDTEKTKVLEHADISFMNIVAQSEELEIFNAPAM